MRIPHPIEAAEQRTIVAHGETMGMGAKYVKAPEGAAEWRAAFERFLPPLPGLGWFERFTHGCRCGLLSFAPPALKAGRRECHFIDV